MVSLNSLSDLLYSKSDNKLHLLFTLKLKLVSFRSCIFYASSLRKAFMFKLFILFIFTFNCY